MLIVMKADATERDFAEVERVITELGFRQHTMPGASRTAIGIPGNELAIFAGPCAVEDREQIFAVAEAVRRSGARFFRGGAFKPRTSPYAFHGLGEEGLKILAEARDKTGLAVVTEVMAVDQVPLVCKYAD